MAATRPHGVTHQAKFLQIVRQMNWLSGAVAHFGEELGVPTPTHHAIYGALKLAAEGRPV